MHELSLAQSVMDMVGTHMQSYPDSSLCAIEIEVGEQSGVDLSTFRTAMNAVIHSSRWPETTVEIAVIAAHYSCIDCGHNFAPTRPDRFALPDLYPSCPKCGHSCCLPVSGREFRLKALRLTDRP